MSENVTAFGDIADKFDALVAYDEKLLDEWVEESGYSLGSMVTASTLMAFMTFAKGFVDVGRIGNGILVEGGFKGVGKDALRALNIAGGAGAVISRGARLLRFTQVGNTCVPVAQTNALRLSGQRFLITIEEFAARAGINLPRIAAVGREADTYENMITALRQMGINVRTITEGTRMGVQQVLNLVKANTGGVVTFSIRTANETLKHRLYATYTQLGGLVIRDPDKLVKIYRSVADIEKVWGTGAIISEAPVVFIPNAFITTAASVAETVGGLGSLAVQVVPIVQVMAADGETAVQALTVREELAKTGGRPPGFQNSLSGGTTSFQNSLSGGAGKYHTVVRGDWLSKIAKHYYGNMHKWPVIFEANRKTIGRNPNVIKPGQNLFIPNLPHARLIAAASLPGQANAAVA